MDILIMLICALSVGVSVVCLVVLLRLRAENRAQKDALARFTAQEVTASVEALSRAYVDAVERGMTTQNDRIRELTQTLSGDFAHLDERFAAHMLQSGKQADAMREENRRALDEIRGTVDEKLQKTLEERINRSFAVVSERLEQVYKGLGEMQQLASGVGDLKKVLSNVKTRGILGEIQLGAILEEILAPEQYETNVVTRKNSAKPVEYAIKLPGADGETVYLPIDSKFPADTYEALRTAYESGDPIMIAAQKKQLEQSIKLFAKDIRDKYLDPPATTEFGVMFLPFEGLYAEVVNLGLIEVLARDYKVSIAGPTTMAALLNSLQMGFRTLAIQKRSSEVWKVLGAVRTEFDRFGDVLEATQKRLEQTSTELDRLVGVRTRQIRAKLRSVTSLSEEDAARLLDDEGDDAQN